MAAITGGRLDRLHWPSEMEEFFILLLLERLRKDIQLRQNNWEDIDTEMSSKFALRLGVNRLKEKYNRLKGVYIKFTHLLNQTDAEWDSTTNNVNAPRHVWDKLSKLYRTFRYKGCPHYHYLQELFSSNTTEGAPPPSPNATPLSSSAKRRMEQQSRGRFRNSSAAWMDLQEWTGSSDKLDAGLIIEEPSSSPGKHHNGKYVSSGEKQLDEVVDLNTEDMSIKTKSGKSNQSPKRTKLAATSAQKVVDPYGLEACLELLNEIKAEGSVTPLRYISAATTFQSEHWRKAFMIMPDDVRRVWIANPPPPGR